MNAPAHFAGRQVCGIALVIAIALTACGAALPAPTVTPIPTPTADPNVCTPADLEQINTQAKDIATRFHDSAELAANAPRISLAPLVKDMQTIRREVDALQLPSCATNAKNRMIDWMDVSIKALMAFMRQDSDSSVASQLDAMDRLRIEYEEALAQLSATPEPPK